MSRNLTRYAIFVTLLVVLATITITGAGCEEGKAPPPEAGMAISSTLVPNTDLDVYVYLKQEKPTTVPKEMLGTPSDVSVESLALWGIPDEDSFTFGGGLTLDSPDDAAGIHGRIPEQGELWASLSNQTIYFVYGSGSAADTLKSAISKNDFKYYDDQEALLEVSLFPNGGTTKLAAVAIAKPSKKLVKLITGRAAPEVSGLLDILIASANLQVLAAGLYSPQQIDVAEVAKEAGFANSLKSEAGVLASIKSGLPGVVVSTIAGKALESAGYVKTNLGELTIYKGYLDAGDGQTMPLLLRVEDNRIFAAVSGQESYAETLITSVNVP